jgi:hypothetical protein
MALTVVFDGIKRNYLLSLNGNKEKVGILMFVESLDRNIFKICNKFMNKHTLTKSKMAPTVKM